MADFVAKIMADLDDTKFSSQIKELQNKYKGSKIDIELNIAGEEKKFRDLGKQTGKQLSQGINSSAAKDVKNITSEYSTLMSVIKDISKYNVQLAKVDPKNTNEIQTLNKLLSEAEERLVGLMAQMKTPVDFSEYSTFSETVRKLAANEELAASKTADFKKKLAENINVKFVDGTFESQVATLEAKLRSLGVASNYTETEIEELRAAIKEMGRTDIGVDEKIATFNKYQSTLQKCSNEIKIMQQNQKGLPKTLSSMANSLIQFASTYIGVQEVFNALRKGVQTVIDLDYALIDLQKTTTMTSAELDSFYLDANKAAKEMGVTTQQIIDQASAWSRLGYSSKDSATEMAKLSSMFATISPGMSVDAATEGLVSVMKAYGYDVEDVLDGIMSKINIVGNTAATSNDQIIEGLQNSASAMATMGSTLDETIALFTAGQEITQDASKTGNALRSMSMRIRGYDEETEELSDDLANITGEVIDLTKVASNNHQGVSLFTDASQTQYKSIYQYLSEISEIYDELDQKSQQELLEKLFGKNRVNVGAAIITNFGAAEKAMTDMANSAGSAEAEMAIATDSIEYKLNALSETWTGIAQTAFQRDDIKAVVDLLITLSEAIGAVVEQLGLVGTIGVGSGIFAVFKNLG